MVRGLSLWGIAAHRCQIVGRSLDTGQGLGGDMGMKFAPCCKSRVSINQLPQRWLNFGAQIQTKQEHTHTNTDLETRMSEYKFEVEDSLHKISRIS